MERKRVICLFLFVGFMVVFSSCHSRHLSDIKPAMTREEVVSLWGRTDLISYKTTGGTTLETWEYHFATSGSICWITFIQDRVAATQCHRNQGGGWYYSQGEREPYPEPYYYPQFYNYSYYSPYYYPFFTHILTTTEVIIVTTALIPSLTAILITVIGGSHVLYCPKKVDGGIEIQTQSFPLMNI